MYKVSNRIWFSVYIHGLLHVIHQILSCGSWKYVVVVSNSCFDLQKCLLNGIEVRRIRGEKYEMDTCSGGSMIAVEKSSIPYWPRSSTISSPWWMCALSITRTLSGPGNGEQRGSCNEFSTKRWPIEVRDIPLDSAKIAESHPVSLILQQLYLPWSLPQSIDLQQRAIDLIQTPASFEHVSPSFLYHIIDQEFCRSWKSHQGIQVARGCTVPCVTYNHFGVVHYVPWW